MPVETSGFRELDQTLKQFGKESTRRAIMRTSMRAGLRPVVKKAKAEAPRGQRQRGTKRKRLAASLASKVVTYDDHIVGIVGQDSKKAKHSSMTDAANATRAVNVNLIEHKVSPHWIDAGYGGVLSWQTFGSGRGKSRVRQFFARVYHRGYDANPFLSRAAKASLEQAERIMVSKAKAEAAKRLAKARK